MNTNELEGRLKKEAPLLRWEVRELVAELTPEPEIVVRATAWVNDDRLYADVTLSELQIVSMGEDSVVEWILLNVSHSMAGAIVDWTPSPWRSPEERALEYAMHVWPGVSDKTRIEIMPGKYDCHPKTPYRMPPYSKAETIHLEPARNLPGISHIGYGPKTDTLVIALEEGGEE